MWLLGKKRWNLFWIEFQYVYPYVALYVQHTVIPLQHLVSFALNLLSRSFEFQVCVKHLHLSFFVNFYLYDGFDLQIHLLLWPNAGWCLRKGTWLLRSPSCWSCQTTGYYLSTVSILCCELPTLTSDYDNLSPSCINNAISTDTYKFFFAVN